jgi:hypothetical protein
MKGLIVVSVEGATEREFVQQVLVPHFAPMGLALDPVPVSGCVSLTAVKDELRILVKRRDCPWVTTLYDLYGFQQRKGRGAEEMETALHKVVGNAPKFIPYVQAHEFEALLFAGPAAAASVLGNPTIAAKMRRILQEHGDAPETINDGYDTCPSRRLKHLHPAYDKVLHGPPIAAEIGLAAIRAACPRFDGWLTRLERLI